MEYINQERDMNSVQIWFMIIAALLGVGIPFLFLGLELPNAMHASILNEAAEYAILDEEDQDFWAEIPGRTGMNDIKKYYIFECQNPDIVAARGVKPNLTEVGPFEYNYVHKFAEREYSEEDNVKNSRVSFLREFSHKFKGNKEDLNKEYRTINLAGMKKWNAVKKKARFQMAIEGFFELFFYARNNLPRDMVIRDLVSYYHNVDHIYDLTKDLIISRDVRTALAHDHNYGLLLDQNVYEWSMMCDTVEPYIEHEIMTYFGLSIPVFETIRIRFCHDYLTRYDALIKKFCVNIPWCTNYNITYNQWMYANLIHPNYYKDYTYKMIFGHFEYPLFEKEFFAKLNPEYTEQFKKVKWDDKSYHYIIDTYYEYPDFETDPSSLLLFDNMKQLFEAGMKTANPFKGTQESKAELDLSSFERISKTAQLTKEQAFMMYCYFDYFVNNTVLLQQFGGTIDKERIAHHGALTFKDISLYNLDYLDIVIYSRALHKRAGTKTCEDAVKYYFTINETENLMTDLVNAICLNTYFNSDLSQAQGWKYFLEASSFPYHFYWWVLENYLVRAVPGFTNDTLDAMMFRAHSNYVNQLEDIKMKVKAHYNSKTKDHACENTFAKYCSKRQLFIEQFTQSTITAIPYPEAELPATKYIGDWWPIIQQYVEYFGTPNGRRKSPREPLPLPEVPIEVPVEFSFLTQNYGGTAISKVDMFNCFTQIGIYDTDVLYYIFLNIKTPSKVGKYQNFASPFFFNSTRYLLRNLEFGPMFEKTHPEQIYFGYFNRYIAAQHKAVDYLDGDDCTVNPWIGYNPIQWDMLEKTFEHLKLKHKMHAGADNNEEIRRYKLYHGQPNVTYRKLIQDESGDNCPFITANPFSQSASTDKSTDGYQFKQYPGKTPKGDMNYVLDRDSQRPLQVVRRTSNDYKFNDLEVNAYSMDFNSDYGCEKGVYIKNALDMTSFLQMHSIITKPRLTDIDEPGLIKPIIRYNYPIDNDEPPYGITKFDSYYVVEPYTGITLQFEKKIMTSLVLYYDELYDKLPDGGLGELLPYYSLYENSRVTNKFVDDMENDINSSQSTRKAVTVVFTVLGFIFVLSGLGMGIKACLVKGVNDEEPTSTSPSEPKNILINKEDPSPPKEPIKENMLIQDLQQETKEPVPVQIMVSERKEPAQNLQETKVNTEEKKEDVTIL